MESKKQLLNKEIKVAEKELRKRRIRVVVGAFFIYAAIFYFVFNIEEPLERIVTSIVMGGIFFFVSLVLYSIGFYPLSKSAEYIEKLEKEYYNIEE